MRSEVKVIIDINHQFLLTHIFDYLEKDQSTYT